MLIYIPLRTFANLLLSVAVAAIPYAGIAQSLEQQLMHESAAALASAARQNGDAVSGARLFYQQHLTCAKCHSIEDSSAGIGPNLADLGERVSDIHIVESILDPSKAIRRGYETTTIATDNGAILTGRVIKDEPTALQLLDMTQQFKPVSIRRSAIEQMNTSLVSMMPTGLANQLENPQQFLDVARYVMERTEKGSQRAAELRPLTEQLMLPPLPDYEKYIDHAGIIADWNDEGLRRGAAIYHRLCVNCHGTKDQPGVLPTAPRFSTAALLKNGNDPYSMYRTLTSGYGLMTPQRWMVPREKYDVIHYIRETYFKDENPPLYSKVDAAYLAALPKGSARGPEPSKFEPWLEMDYGPTLMATLEIGTDGTNFVYKGIAARLDEGPGGIARGRHWMEFDHDTMRMAAAWSGDGFIDWNGINFNGRMKTHPRIVGQVEFLNQQGPGWADPYTGSFEDPRPVYRDGRRYGPLPHEWCRYQGVYHFGQRSVVAYTVGETEVLESPGVISTPGAVVFTRTLRLGPRATELTLQVATHNAENAELQPVKQAKGSQQCGVRFGSASRQGKTSWLVVAVDRTANGKWMIANGQHLRLTIPAGETPLQFTLRMTRLVDDSNIEQRIDAWSCSSDPDLTAWTQGGAPRWNVCQNTLVQPSHDKGPFAVDILTHPETNPWACRMR